MSKLIRVDKPNHLNEAHLLALALFGLITKEGQVRNNNA
ncbi:unnamed protein product [Brassica rapa]|uniref:Uncharacterized protein n=2 Tax=Brassica TaxID=3705 RepID=A0A8D9I0S9_BRACM|nr:unnamed protein product [Brassica napus]CAG7907131.1 unnamed protein product [Brassica rapa]